MHVASLSGMHVASPSGMHVHMASPGDMPVALADMSQSASYEGGSPGTDWGGQYHHPYGTGSQLDSTHVRPNISDSHPSRLGLNSDDSAAGNMPKGWNPMCDTPGSTGMRFALH